MATIYLSNRELLAALNESKKSYCSFARPEYADYDVIIRDLKEITPALIEVACEKRIAASLNKARAETRADKKNGIIVPRVRTPVPPPATSTIDHSTLVFRLMTNAHIPLDPTVKARANTKGRAKTNFPPFAHYVLIDGVPTEVGRSHWVGSLSNGHFAAHSGKMSNRLGMMFLTLVDRYGRRANFRNYSYLEEMRGLALVQLSQVGLQFDESKSDNPFAFYTSTVRNCFVRTLNVEKKAQMLRDDLLICAGASPSSTRVTEHEMAQRASDY